MRDEKFRGILNDFVPYKKIFKNREFRLKLIGLTKIIPSSLYLKLVYKAKTGECLHLNKPVTFCEKLNWLKLHNKNPEYTLLVDKVLVRDIVNRRMGKDMFFPLLGVWNRYEDIDFDLLPDRFVLKCNHDSGSVKVIGNKSEINHAELKEFYNGRLKINPYYLGREYPYKGVKPKIIAEQYMVPNGSNDINDYKFFCFGGKPELLFVATSRSSDCKFDFYDMDFRHLDITNIHPQSGKIIEKPSCFEEMKKIAEELSHGMPFVRIDLYEIDGKVYFGEYTFFHGGGFWPMYPDDCEKRLGELIQLKGD